MLEAGTILNHRYRIISLLGAGGMGEVYLVEDSQIAKRQLALKLMRESMTTQDEIRALKREFTFLKQLYHPNIPRVFDFGHTEEGVAYYTAEFLEGQDLESINLCGKWRLLIEVMVQICRALSFLHSRNLVHHDVKPENIRIVGDMNEVFTVKLVDFGLASGRKTGLKGVKGSLETMAPEILQDKPYDHRVDLYALGVVLYRAAIGQSPFPGDDPLLALKQRLTCEPPSLKELCPEIPEALEVVVRKLMSPEPRDRYQSARETVIDLSERLGESLEPETPETLKCYIDSGVFTAHRDTYQALCKYVDEAGKGNFPIGLLVTGERGIGKSRLVREIQTYAQLKRVALYRVGCGRERGITLEPVLDIVRFWKDLNEEQLRQIIGLGNTQSDLEASFDPLRRQQHLLKVVDWFEAIARKDRVILVFEDIQLADQLTLDFLKFLVHRMDSKYLSLWFTYEPSTQETASLTTFLNSLKSQKFKEYLLSPMDETGCKTLVKSMFPSNCFPEQFYGKIYSESGGNPYHLKLLLNSLVDKQLIKLHGELWDFSGDVLNITHSHNLDQVFVDRIQSIRGKSREVARVLGVSRGSLRLSELSAILKRPEGEITQDIIPLIHNGWVSQYNRNGHLWIGFNHPGFCSAVVADLTSEQLKKLRLKIVHYYQKSKDSIDPRIQESLGYHWLKIGDAEQVANYSLQAGQAILLRFDPYAARDYWLETVELLEKHSEYSETLKAILVSLAKLQRDLGEHRQSIQTFQQIRDSLNPDNDDQQVMCLNQIALMQDRLGETEEAKNNWLKCLELLKGGRHDDVGVIYGGLGWLAFREGDHEEAVAYCRRGLALMERREASSQKAYLLNTLGTLCFYRGEIEDALKLWRKSLKLRQLLGHQKGISDLHNNIGAALGAMGKRKGAKWHWNRSLEISQQIGDVERTAGIYNNLGIQAYEQGKLLDATRYYQQAYNILNRLGAKRDMASALNNLGEVALKRAEYVKAMEYWEQALEIGNELADKESQIEPLYQLGHLHLLLCEYEEAETQLTDSETIANQINASGSLGSIYELLARLALQSNDLEKARQYITRSVDFLKRSGDQLKLARGLITEAQIAAIQGQYKTMNDCLEQANQLSKETGEQHLMVSSALCTLQHSLEHIAENADNDNIMLTLKDAVAKGESFPELSWQVHWMKGKFLKSKGQWKAATEAYSQSISILKQISRRLPEPHQSNYLKGQAQQRFRQEVIELKKIMNG